MSNRGLLRSQVKQAWCDVIREAYAEQVINSERALQVHLGARLLDAFWARSVNRRLFVEPNIRTGTGGARLHPDLLVCNTRQVIGVIEIKYQPHRRPQYAKDFQSLESVAWEAEDLEITNRRYRGPRSGRQSYSLASDALFVWAGVYRAPCVRIPEGGVPSHLKKRLMVLHAVCHLDTSPTIYLGTRRIQA